MQWEQFIKQVIEGMGFGEYGLELDLEHHHGSVFIYNQPPAFGEYVPGIVEAINHISQMLAQKHGDQPVVFDVNNYRKEREKLIAELAKAAARKVRATKEAVSLPAMNSYERRLIHVELATHPDVITESEGAGKNRYVTIRLTDGEKKPQPIPAEGSSEL